jgi:hypothetical protein
MLFPPGSHIAPFRRVVVDADADPAGMHTHFLGIALRAALPAVVLEVAHELLLLRSGRVSPSVRHSGNGAFLC